MPFNHYSKMKAILNDQPKGWYIKRIDLPTKAKSFSGEVREFDHYYRVYDNDDNPIKYCKFQQLDRFIKIMNIEYQDLTIIS